MGAAASVPAASGLSADTIKALDALPDAAKAELMEKVQGYRVMGLEASKYRVRCVSYGLPKDGFAAGMAATIPYFSSPDPMMPEGVVKEVFLTTADETKQFILLFYEAKAEKRD